MVVPIPAQISRLLLRLHGANPPTTHLPPSSPSSASRNTRIPSALNSFHILPVATEVYHQSIPDDNLSSLQTRQLFCLHRLAASFPSLCALFCTGFLCFQSFAASFSKAPGVGVLKTFALSFASAVTCATCRLYPLCPHSIAHTSCHHGGVGRATEFPSFSRRQFTTRQRWPSPGAWRKRDLQALQPLLDPDAMDF